MSGAGSGPPPPLVRVAGRVRRAGAEARRIDFSVGGHPSETRAFVSAVILARLLEDAEGIELRGGGVSSGDLPAMYVRDASGRIARWIEVGRPDPQRLLHADRGGARVTVYIYGTPAQRTAFLERAGAFRSTGASGTGVAVVDLPKEWIRAVEQALGRRLRLDLDHGPHEWLLSVAGCSPIAGKLESRLVVP